jgi:hypothetical protein
VLGSFRFPAQFSSGGFGLCLRSQISAATWRTSGSNCNGPNFGCTWSSNFRCGRNYVMAKIRRHVNMPLEFDISVVLSKKVPRNRAGQDPHSHISADETTEVEPNLNPLLGSSWYTSQITYPSCGARPIQSRSDQRTITYVGHRDEVLF